MDLLTIREVFYRKFSTITGIYMFKLNAWLQKCLFLAITIAAIGNNIAFSRGYSAILALRHSPSPIAQSMALTGVAIDAEDAYSIWHNPAHVGMESLENNLVFNFYPGKTKMYQNFFTGMSYSNTAAIAGYNFGLDSSNIPLSIGVGMIDQRLELGLPNLDSTFNIAKFIPYEKVYGLSAGACLDVGIKIALGFTYKNISSDYYAWMRNDSAKTVYDCDAVDLGVIIKIPIMDTKDLIGGLKMKADATAAFAITNFGGKIDYQSKGEPIPRTASIGYAFTADLGYQGQTIYYNLLKADWTMEFEDYLVRRTEKGIEYETPFSDMNLIQNLFLLKNPFREVVKYGAKFTIFNSFLVMIGNFNSTGPTGDNIFTIGYGIKLLGALDYIALNFQSDMFKFLSRHFDVGFYYTSRAETQVANMPEYNRDYTTFTLSVKNFDLF